VGFLDRVERDVAAATQGLQRHFDVVSSGLIHTVEGAAEEARRFNREGVEAIVFCPIIWTNDPPVVAFIREARRVPLLLWAYSPYEGLRANYTITEWLRSSGPVSVQQSANIFKRFGWDFEVAFGREDDNLALADILAFVRAALVKNSLVGTRIAVLPKPCRVVMSTWLDEHFLLDTFGVELEYVSVQRFKNFVDAVPECTANEYVAELRRDYPVQGVSEAELLDSARQALAFVRLAEEEKLSGIALEDFDTELSRALRFRPHLTHPSLSELGCTVGMEADVLGILSTLIVGRLAGRPGMFNEFFSIDPHENHILMGHPGHGEITMGEPGTFTVTRDLEIDPTQPAGAWLSYRAKPGPMTFLNLTPEYGRLKAATFTGQSLPGPRCMEGYAHMRVSVETDVLSLFQRIVKLGLIQHWGTVHGDVTRELRYLFRMLGLDLIELQGSPI
jgi:L-fucose isomerase-like protein